MRNPKQGGGASGKTTPCCSKVGIKRGPWTAEEDEILAGYIKRDGEGAWRTLPKRAGLLRCGKSCRLRWMNYLRPHLNRGPISPDEEDLILRLHRLLGNRWSLIAGRIPGRTDNEIKNFWNTHLSKKLISQGLDPRTHKPLEIYNPNPNDNCSSVYDHTYNNNHGVRSSPIEDVNPNPNPILATSSTPVMLNRSEACTTTSYNHKNEYDNNHGAADYSTTIHGFGPSRGEIQDYNDEMFSSFLDSLIVNEEGVFQQTSVINSNHDHQMLGDEFMMQSVGYGSTSQGFNDHCGSVWGSEVSPLMGSNDERDEGKCNRNLDPADVHRY